MSGSRPRRGEQWSLRQAHLAVGVTQATARSLTRSGVLGALEGKLSLADVLALKVAATVSGVVFPGEARPANQIRDALPRELLAVAHARELAASEVPTDGSVLLVYPSTVRTAHSPAELAASVLAPGDEPYLVLPAGQWLKALRATAAESVDVA